MTEHVRTGKHRTSYAQGWALYPFSMIGHHAQGAGAAVAAYSGKADYSVW